MAIQDTIKHADVSLLIGDGVTPTEGFDAVCGFTTYNWTTNTNETSEDLLDCDDPAAPGYITPDVAAVGDTFQAQGYVDVDNSDLFYAWIQSGLPKNVRIKYDKAGKMGRYAGPAIITNREEAYERRQSGRINVTLKFRSPPVWTADP